jgi:uncharacterized membrane protein
VGAQPEEAEDAAAEQPRRRGGARRHVLGLLFGLLFFAPLLGAAIGAAAGALGGSLTDVGIDDGFIDSVRSKVTAGTSALFLLSSGAVGDKVLPALKEQGIHPELIQTNLSAEEEARLRAAFEENV